MTLARKLAIALGAVTIGWLVVLVVWGPAPFAASFDDAYYYFTIGRNWAHGHASTFDGIDRTNGYHPLWQLISILPYLTGLNGLAAVRSLLVLQLLLWAGAMVLVIRTIATIIGDRSHLADNAQARRWCETTVVVVFVVLAANPFVFKMTVNGLESGLVVPVGAAFIAHAVRFRGRYVSRATSKQRWVTGALLALAFLSRTDSVILIAVLVLWCLLDRGGPELSWPQRLSRVAQVLVIPVCVIGAYLITNAVFFDTPLQISGTVKRLPLTPLRVVLALVWAAVGVGILIAARRPIRKSSRFVRTRRFIAATGFYLAFCVGLLGYYTTLQEVPYLWYFAPLALEGTLLALLLMADLSEGAVLEAAEKSGGRVTLAAGAPALILLVPLVAALAWSIPSYVDPGARSLMEHDAETGSWINQHLPPGARIASWDAGTIGYFAQRHVVNLDGVVNSHAFFDATRHGHTAEFLADRDVRWVTNHGGDVNGRDPDIHHQIRSYFGYERAATITVVFRTTYDYTGSLDGSRTDTSTKRMGTYVYRLDPRSTSDRP